MINKIVNVLLNSINKWEHVRKGNYANDKQGEKSTL